MHSRLPAGWVVVDPVAARALATELGREVSRSHVLHGCSFTAIARRGDRDDVLFEVVGAQAKLYVVHLTWRKESSSEWPAATAFADFEAFLAEPDADD